MDIHGYNKINYILNIHRLIDAHGMKLTGFSFFLGKELTEFSKIINTYKIK